MFEEKKEETGKGDWEKRRKEREKKETKRGSRRKKKRGKGDWEKRRKERDKTRE